MEENAMNRSLMTNLLAWMADSDRKPLLIRGARQVGKSHLVREFSRQFDSFMEINFEMDPALDTIFSDSLDPQLIIERLSVYKEMKVIPGKTLLFLDEIQAAPRALIALRYFYEKMPQLHVVAAGSLIEFILEKTGMPVGRVSSLYLYPLSFKEFLMASGKEKLCLYIDQHAINTPIDAAFIGQLMTCFAQYMIIGGMPEAVRTWLESKDFKRVRSIQTGIVETYKQDFLKYARNQQVHHVEKVFAAVPRLMGRKFVYTHVDETLKGREIRPAIELLEKAQVIHRVRHSSANGTPLESESNDAFFKAIFLDVGLAQAILGLSARDWMLDIHHTVTNKGAMVEAFAGQELLAYSDAQIRKKLFYWVREKTNAQAEVDYIIEHDGRIIPVEVKSGKSGSLKSLVQFLKEKPHARQGIHLSLGNFGLDSKIRRIPLWAIWRIFNAAVP
jgi:predicted AAA+ superfamily ATPase